MISVLCASRNSVYHSLRQKTTEGKSLQTYQGREGERLTLGLTGLKTDFVGVLGRDGRIEILVADADRGETAADLVAEARRRILLRSREHKRALTRRRAGG